MACKAKSTFTNCQILSPSSAPVSNQRCEQKSKLFAMERSVLGKIILFPCIALRKFQRKKRTVDHKQQQQLQHESAKSTGLEDSNDANAAVKAQTLPNLATTDWIYRTGWTPQPDPLALLDSGWCSECYFHIRKDLQICPSCGMYPVTLAGPRRRHHCHDSNYDRRHQKRLSEIGESC